MLSHGCQIAFKLACEPDSIPFAPLLHRDFMMPAAVSKTLKRGAATGAESPRGGKKQRTASDAKGGASQALQESVTAASAHASLPVSMDLSTLPVVSVLAGWFLGSWHDVLRSFLCRSSGTSLISEKKTVMRAFASVLSTQLRCTSSQYPNRAHILALGTNLQTTGFQSVA